MKLCVFLLVLIGLLMVCDPTKAIRVRRQWAWGDDDNSNNDRPQRPPRPSRTTTTTTTTTTLAPLTNDDAQIQACVSACQVTPQYNPICGTNQVTYNNRGNLDCARNCGLAVEVSFLGTCQPL